MSPEEIKLLKVGDVVTDRITGAKFSVVEVKSNDVLPVCLKLITDIKEPIYLNLKAYTSSYFTEIGEEFWVFVDYQEAYKYYLPCDVYQGRRILTCTDLELKEESPWKTEIKAKEVAIEQSDYLVSLSELVKLSEKRLIEDLTTINQVIQQRYLDSKEIAIQQSLLKSKVEDKALLEEIRSRGYTVKISDGRLVISGW